MTTPNSDLVTRPSDDDRRRYAAGLSRVVEPGGRLFLVCFSDEEPGTDGPVVNRNVSEIRIAV
jgi:hypothetical protein